MSRASKLDRLAAQHAERERLRRDDYPRYLATRDLEDRRAQWKAAAMIGTAFLLGMGSVAAAVAVALRLSH